MKQVLLVGLGGFIGAVLRYGVSGAVQRIGAGFPAGTLTVNVVGCLAIGFLSQVVETRSIGSPEFKALVVVGVLGGFTTFSAFASETSNAARGGAYHVATLNVVLSVVLCLAAVWIGRVIAMQVTR